MTRVPAGTPRPCPARGLLRVRTRRGGTPPHEATLSGSRKWCAWRLGRAGGEGRGSKSQHLKTCCGPRGRGRLFVAVLPRRWSATLSLRSALTNSISKPNWTGEVTSLQVSHLAKREILLTRSITSSYAARPDPPRRRSACDLDISRAVRASDQGASLQPWAKDRTWPRPTRRASATSRTRARRPRSGPPPRPRRTRTSRPTNA